MNQRQILQLINSNPKFKNNIMVQNAMKMAEKGDIKGLENLANNLASSKGISIDDVRQRLGI